MSWRVLSLLQGEEEYSVHVKLYGEVDPEESRWTLLSTKVCTA